MNILAKYINAISGIENPVFLKSYFTNALSASKLKGSEFFNLVNWFLYP
jgi:hypothetical protein